ncbi:hypothetical protein [Bradyrhizobium manausense]|nr:hypothetical protein [Bradyrhizobium manausense]
MAGLVPAIHALFGGQDVDAPNKPGHDDEKISSQTKKPALTAPAF